MTDSERQKNLILDLEKRNKRLVEQNIDLQQENEQLKRQQKAALIALKGGTR